MMSGQQQERVGEALGRQQVKSFALQQRPLYVFLSSRRVKNSPEHMSYVREKQSLLQKGAFSKAQLKVFRDEGHFTKNYCL